MRRPANQVVARNLRGVERIGRYENTRVVIRVVAGEHQPVNEASFDGDVSSSRAGQVGVEEIAPKCRAASRLRDGARAEGRARSEADDVVEAAGKIVGGDFHAVVGKFLLNTGAPRFAGFWLERGSSRAAGAAAGGLVE